MVSLTKKLLFALVAVISAAQMQGASEFSRTLLTTGALLVKDQVGNLIKKHPLAASATALATAGTVAYRLTRRGSATTSTTATVSAAAATVDPKELEQLRKEKADVSKELENVKTDSAAKLKEATREKEQEAGSVTKLEATLKAKQEEYNTLVKKEQDAQSKLKTTENEVKDLRAKVAASSVTEDGNKQLQAKIADKIKECAGLAKQLEDIQERLKQAEAEKAGLTRQLEDMQQRLIGAQQASQQSKAEAAQSASEAQQLKAELDHANTLASFFEKKFKKSNILNHWRALAAQQKTLRYCQAEGLQLSAVSPARVSASASVLSYSSSSSSSKAQSRAKAVGASLAAAAPTAFSALSSAAASSTTSTGSVTAGNTSKSVAATAGTATGSAMSSSSSSASAGSMSAAAQASLVVTVPAASKPAAKIDDKDKKKDKEKAANKKKAMPAKDSLEYATIQQKIKQRGVLHEQLQQLKTQQAQAVTANSTGVPIPDVTRRFHEKNTLLESQIAQLDTDLAEYGIQAGPLPAQKPVTMPHYQLPHTGPSGRITSPGGTKRERRVLGRGRGGKR